MKTYKFLFILSFFYIEPSLFAAANLEIAPNQKRKRAEKPLAVGEVSLCESASAVASECPNGKHKVSEKRRREESWLEFLDVKPIPISDLQAAFYTKSELERAKIVQEPEGPLIPAKTLTKKNTLVLDLDETLITSLAIAGAKTVPVAGFFVTPKKSRPIMIRPGAKEFLKNSASILKSSVGQLELNLMLKKL